MNPVREKAFELPCCIEGPSTFIPKVQYALQMLLLPMRINPVWCTKSSLSGKGLYYGLDPTELPSEVVSLRLEEDTCRYFESLGPYNATQVHWRELDSVRYPVLFNGSNPAKDDIIASAFFWLSGWQEYTISDRDRHGRFPFASSLQAAFGIAREPVVEVYREVLKQQLLLRDIPVNNRSWEERTWAFCPTHDIDYLRKWRPGMIYREVVERFLTNSSNGSVGQRFSRLGLFAKDALQPGDIFRKSFTRIIDETEQRNGRATIFLKTGAHGPHDVFYSPQNGFLKAMLERLKGNDCEVGLHPSYYAHTHAGYLAKEKELLEGVWGSTITTVRQHYLRYSLPHTLRLQLEAGFTIDSTLAFAEHEGFRNATCHPFLRYDVLKNEATNSWEMPLCFMDGSLFNYRGLGVDEAIDISKQLILACKKYNGVCVGLWHNTLWDEMDFPGWGRHYLEIMNYVEEEEGHIDSLSGALGGYLNLRN